MRGRVPQLDALRGVAAATVVWHHWHAAFHVTAPRWYLYPLMAGHEAVILFFVLSGYVLSLPTWSGRSQRYPEYLMRRITRIYLPYLSALTLAAVGCYFFVGHHVPGVSYWFYLTWQQRLSGPMLLSQIFMSSRPLLNTAFWSLGYEMQMSIVFPFVCWLMLYLSRFSGLILVLVVRGLASVLVKHGFPDTTNTILILYYSAFFILGAALARERKPLLAWLARVPSFLVATLFGASLLAYFYATFFTISQRSADSVDGLASLALILLIQDPRLRVGLRSRFAEYLGRISYSSYLVHGTVLFVLLDTVYTHVPTWGFFVLYGVLSLAAAHVFCVLVEEPSMRLGKRLSVRMNRPAAD